MDDTEINARIRSLVEGLGFQSNGLSPQWCKPTIYDTAWISMLSRFDAEDTIDWVFQDSFQLILDTQQQNGGWMANDSKIDTILNTLAATLALKRHCRHLRSNERDREASLESRCSKAMTFLQTQISGWQPEVGAHVGVEVLLPALLSMLERENVFLPFPGRQSLMEQNRHLFAQFDLQSLYEKDQSPMLYFLEALNGQVDYKRLSHHKVNGGIMRSPSSTVGYLIGLGSLDKDCEAYLEDAIRAAGNTGGVPNIYPPHGLMFARVVETLLDNGVSKSFIFTERTSDIVSSTLGHANAVQMRPGLVPGFSTDEHLARYLLGKLQWPERTDVQIEALQDQMMRHVNEYVANFDTRCCILKTLLRSPRIGDYERHVVAMGTSLCDSYWTGATNDGQNLSPYYHMMLFVQSFAEIHRLSDNGSSERFASRIVQERAPVAIVQILAKILSTQNNNGSWGPLDCAETIAYALLALLEIVTLPYTQLLRTEIQYAVAKGREALSMTLDTTTTYPLWVGKVAYGSETLSEAFSLAAMKKSFVEQCCGERISVAMQMQTQKCLRFVKYFSGLNHLNNEAYAMIKVSILEASFYRSALKARRTDIFPQTSAKEKDKYLEYIPIMWILAGTCYGVSLPPEYLLDMMVLSMFIFLTDEYMESKVAQLSKEELLAFRKSMDVLSLDEVASRLDISQAVSGQTEHLHSAESGSDRLTEAIAVFSAFAKAVMNYPRVVDASETDKLELRAETRNYLLYHVHQLEDNARFAQQVHQPGTNTEFATPRTSYQTWVHTIGAGHISGPFAFACFACSMGGSVRGGADCFSNVKQKLMAHGMNAHYGAFTRMYNDYGSIARDAEERNLNSVNFPEFFGNGLDFESAKQALLDAARYERRCAVETAEVLYRELEAEGSVGKKVADRLRVYIGGGEQFSDMYVTRDVTNSVK